MLLLVIQKSFTLFSNIFFFYRQQHPSSYWLLLGWCDDVRLVRLERVLLFGDMICRDGLWWSLVTHPGGLRGRTINERGK